MPSNYANIVSGLAAQLRAQITGLTVYTHPADSPNAYPAACILPEPIEPEIALSGNSFSATLRIVFLLASGDAKEGYDQIYDYIDPTQANKSVIKAVRADRTLGGNVDDCDVERIENIGRRELSGGNPYGFDALVGFIKSVA